MYGQQRTKFELLPLNTFIRCMGVYPPGTTVALSNEAMAIVVSVNSARPMKPTVLVHDPNVPRDQAILVELEREAGLLRAYDAHHREPVRHGRSGPKLEQLGRDSEVV